MNLKSTKKPRHRFRNGILRRAIYVCTALVLLSWSSYGQSRRVTGTVTATDGSPLIGAMVVVEGTARGTVTDARGAYAIETTNENNVLKFSYMGMTTVTETVGKRTVINAQLEDTAHDIEAVVVEVGYGQKAKVDLTGSVGMIGGDELSKIPVSSAAQALTGKIAGLSIVTSEGAPGAEISIKVRGGSSITGDNSPLYIIDGFPSDDGLSNVDMSQIESISVLKDASSTAIYGARGANGVILVTTKMAKNSGVTVNYNGRYSIREISNYLDVMTPYEFMVLRFEQQAGTTSASSNELFNSKWGNWYDAWDTYGNMPPIDWQRAIAQTGHEHYHNLQVSGGSDYTKFLANVSWVDEKGVLVNTAADKLMARLRVTHNTKDNRVKLNFNVDFTETSITGDKQYGQSNKLIGAVMHRPMPKMGETVEEMMDEVYDSETLESNSANDYMENPVTEHKNEYKKETKRALKIQGSVDLLLVKSLVLRAAAGLNTGWNYNDRAWFAQNSNAKKSGGPYAQISNGSNRKWNTTVTLNYNPQLGKDHKLTALVGNEAIRSESRSMSILSKRFESDAIMLDRMQLGTVPGIPTSSASESAIVSFFGRVDYTYKRRYLFTVSMRADGSSVYGPENLWGYFPSASAGWRISEEPWMKEVRWMDQLKLRASYGLSGNNRIPANQWRTIYGYSYYGINDKPNTSAFIKALANPYLKWESVRDLTLGLDFSLFKNRFGGSIDVYQRESKDLLLNAPRNSVSGFDKYYANVGMTQNKGIEIALNSVNIDTKEFMWTTDFNISFNRNMVKALAEGDRLFYSSDFYKSTGSDYIVQVGQPVGTMYGYVLHPEMYYRPEHYEANPNFDPSNDKSPEYALKDGIAYMDSEPQPGTVRFVDLDGDGVIDADNDRTIIGNAQPKFTGGLGNQFTYKGFDLSAFFTFSYGNDIYNANRFRFNSSYSSKQNMLAEMRHRFMTMDENGRSLYSDKRLMSNLAEMARINQHATTYTPYSDMALNHSGYIEDGSYLRLSQVSLGYTFSQKWLRKVQVRSLRVYVTGSNLWTWTNYTGYDPEVDAFSSKNPILMGLDYSAYPRYRSYTFGMNLTF